MDIRHWENVSRIFHAASALPIDRQGEFIDRECGSDAVLRAEVDALLGAHNSFDSFIDSPIKAAKQAGSKEHFGPGDQIGAFRVLSFIGRGGMGEVYLAEDSRLERRVAIKMLPDDLLTDEKSRLRFQQEAKAASSLDHPNIITIFEVDFFSERPYIATEFINGRSLRSLLRSGGMEYDEALRIGCEIADALSAAHRSKIIHRDIKPDNVMVRADGHVKLLDFGLARPMEALSDGVDLTTPGTVIGTVAYMSPEQTRGEEATPPSDIWSFGVLLCELFSGKQPFEGSTPSHTIVAIQDAEPDLSGLPEPVRGVIGQCLRKRPQERPESMDQVLADLSFLRRSSASGAITPRPSEPNRTRRYAIAAIATIILVVLAGAGYWALSERNADIFKSPRLKRLTNSGTELFAAISPDGERLATATDRGSSVVVSTRPVNGETLTEVLALSGERLKGLTFSPSGDYLYYASQLLPEGPNALYRVRLDGGSAERLYLDVASQPSFSPDGKRIVFVRDDGTSSSSLIVAPADGSGPQDVIAVRILPDFFIGVPDWSSDGRWVMSPASSVSGSVEYKVLSYDIASRAESKLTSTPWTTIGQIKRTSSPGRYLLTAREGEGRPVQIWQISGSNEPKRLTSDFSDYWTLSLDARDRIVVATGSVETANVFVGPMPLTDPLTAAGLTQLTFSENAQNGIFGMTALDSGTVYFSSLGPDRTYISEVSQANTNVKPLISDGGLVGLTSLTADSKTLYFSLKDAAGISFGRLDVDTGQRSVVPLSITAGTPIFPYVSPNGKELLFGVATPSGRIELMAKDLLSDAPARKLTEANCGIARFSPDGNWIAMNFQSGKDLEWRIGVMPAGGGPIVQLPITANPSTRFDWTGDSRSIVSVRVDEGVSNLVLFARDAASDRVISSFGKSTVYNLDVSPDGKRIALSVGGRKSDAILISDQP